ncbi:I66 family serine proteinase inhibitor [Nocardia suismassiliense]|uniref:I66 family serine proteinase inhibitor n=1 Tax=Nocardia suismassiliense TaxID=2077092 RepID=A0ABW6R125_9NOCA
MLFAGRYEINTLAEGNLRIGAVDDSPSGIARVVADGGESRWIVTPVEDDPSLYTLAVDVAGTPMTTRADDQGHIVADAAAPGQTWRLQYARAQDAYIILQGSGVDDTRGWSLPRESGPKAAVVLELVIATPSVPPLFTPVSPVAAHPNGVIPQRDSHKWAAPVSVGQ